MYAVLFIGGVFRSLQFSSFNTVVYADVARPQMSAATSLYSTFQQLSMTVGITIGAASLEVARHFTGNQTPSVDDFSVAFIVVALLAASASPLVISLRRDAGDEMSGHHAKG
jgi:hypothetical protein